jgi:hypothetical protein
MCVSFLLDGLTYKNYYVVLTRTWRGVPLVRTRQ